MCKINWRSESFFKNESRKKVSITISIWNVLIWQRWVWNLSSFYSSIRSLEDHRLADKLHFGFIVVLMSYMLFVSVCVCDLGGTELYSLISSQHVRPIADSCSAQQRPQRPVWALHRHGHLHRRLCYPQICEYPLPTAKRLCWCSILILARAKW